MPDFLTDYCTDPGKVCGDGSVDAAGAPSCASFACTDAEFANANGVCCSAPQTSAPQTCQLTQSNVVIIAVVATLVSLVTTVSVIAVGFTYSRYCRRKDPNSTLHHLKESEMAAVGMTTTP